MRDVEVQLRAHLTVEDDALVSCVRVTDFVVHIRALAG